jgi:hypothetical protein
MPPWTAFVDTLTMLRKTGLGSLQSHMKCVKHLLRYIKGTIDRKLVIYRLGFIDSARNAGGNGAHQIVAYADADLGGIRTTQSLPLDM